ncbi:MAG: hypothetical protein Q9162_002525 [Coniocarpon cinnabarinum]
MPVAIHSQAVQLYSKSRKIQDMMSELIDKYFMDNLSLSQSEANELHMKYYKEYGLAIEGLVRHHKVDPLEYNSKVDDALPLEKVLAPDPDLRRLIMDLDRSRVNLWLLTNAYVTHGKRVVKLLGVDDLFDGITFCDYSAKTFVCKPHHKMYERAMQDTGVKSPGQCYFVDDSALNCRAAQGLGWTTAHLVEMTEEPPKEPASRFQIRSLYELPNIFPQFFKSKQS